MYSQRERLTININSQRKEKRKLTADVNMLNITKRSFRILKKTIIVGADNKSQNQQPKPAAKTSSQNPAKTRFSKRAK